MAWIRRILLLLFVPAVALAADDARVTRLEQDVRTLRREVQVLSRQIDELRLQTTRPGIDGRPPPPALALDTPSPSVAAWLDAGKWERLRPGMSELEVISALGPPSSVREQNGTRELLYAMEIGSSTFLGGSVRLRERAVVEVRIPTLK
jgi:hypothetical protein